MNRFIPLALLSFLATPVSALNWQDDDMDWMGGHAFRYLKSASTENLELMLVELRDSDEYGLYHFQFACILNRPDSLTLHMSLTIPWRNPQADAPENVEFTLSFETGSDLPPTQTITMLRDPMGDDHVSWDGKFQMTDTFLANLSEAHSITILMPNGDTIKNFQTRGGALAAATLGNYCVTPN